MPNPRVSWHGGRKFFFPIHKDTSNEQGIRNAFGKDNQRHRAGCHGNHTSNHETPRCQVLSCGGCLRHLRQTRAKVGGASRLAPPLHNQQDHLPDGHRPTMHWSPLWPPRPSYSTQPWHQPRSESWVGQDHLWKWGRKDREGPIRPIQE